jgi:thiamine-monophosphate kinase
MTAPKILSDLGERRILHEIIPKYVSAAGDDCAILDPLEGNVVITTDPVPPPAARLLGGDDDLYWVGWLLVTINASDVAASGAVPQAFVAALEMPATLPIDQLHRLLAGIRDSCTANGFAYVGGNLREGPAVGGVGTALGSSKRPPLTRSGASTGDRLIVIGEGGRFWADAERLRLGKIVDRSTSPIFAPVSQAPTIHLLHADRLLACAMDTSDGLAPTLVELSRTNRLGLRISLETMRLAHRGLCERPERFWMGWGDWTVAAAVRPAHVAEVEDRLRASSVPAAVIGEFADSVAGVVLETRSSRLPLGRLESERFASDSWFARGISEYQRLLHQLPLPEL